VGGRYIEQLKLFEYNTIMTKWLKELFYGREGVDKKESTERREPILHKRISEEERKTIDWAVNRTVEEYGEALKRLGNE